MRNIRNIGISAHIDSGKTTLTERILFYCKKIHKISEVRGKDGVGATMDSMELEKERGITIASAATNVHWKDVEINIIDTPGHVDFTIEVENALRVLDGAVLVLCGVAGVQSQSFTVDRQLKRYKVPHIAFINKLDRTGANPHKAKDQLCEKLGKNAVLLQLPIGIEDNLEGLIDLVRMKARFFDGENGEVVREGEIPENMLEEAKKYHDHLIDSVSMFSDELAEAYLEGKETVEQIDAAIRVGTISNKFTPVLMGTAYKNKGVQLLLDAVARYLPAPEEINNLAYDKDNNKEEVLLQSREDVPAVGLAFKLESQQYGQLTYVRVYQGKINRGDELVNNRTGKKIKVGRLVQMHASSMEDIPKAIYGDIVAFFGVDCALGDTFTSPEISYTMRASHIPTPILSMAIKPVDKKSADNMGKALNRFTKEDPTFKAFFDDETEETIIKGMGELHLNVYTERMKREYGVSLEIGKPQVAYRETISKEIPFSYIHKKQSGGRGQFAHVTGIFTNSDNEENVFSNEIKGGVIPSEYIPGCEKGFNRFMEKGEKTGFPLVGCKVILNDGNYHPVDSSPLAFEIAVISALRENYSKANPVILEPIMKVIVETPSEFRGNVLATINQRRGVVLDTSVEDDFTIVSSEIPLSEIFGYATVLRTSSQGKAEFTMEFARYEKVPKNLEEDIIKTLAEKK